MIRSRRLAITASLIGALLITGVPTLASGHGDGTREAKGYSTAAPSGEAGQADHAKKDEEKAKKDEERNTKKSGEAKNKNAGQKSDDAKNKNGAQKDEAKKDEAKKDDGDKRAADRHRKDNDAKKDDGKKDDAKKDDGKKDGKKEESASGKGGHGKDGKRDVDDKDEWKRKGHQDKHNKDWDHSDSRHRNRRHHDWDTQRRYYKYGYYGPGWYDRCGYYGPNYRGDGDDWYYYGPDACRYEYGGYRSHHLVDMSWDQVLPRSDLEAYGVANLDIDAAAGVVCFRLAYDGFDRAIGGQIHPGRRGEVGPAIVLLHVGSNGDDGCVRADPRILYEIQNDPRGYYLEINDREYGQVLRGQLDAPDYRNRY